MKKIIGRQDFMKGLILSALYFALFVITPPSVHRLAMRIYKGADEAEYSKWEELTISGTKALAVGNDAEALARFQSAYEVSKSGRIGMNIELQQTAKQLGFVYYNLGEYKLSRAFLEESLSLGTDRFGPSSEQVGDVLEILADVHHELGEHRLELVALRRVLGIRESARAQLPTLRSKNEALALALGALGDALEEQGEVSEAQDLFSRKLEIVRKFLTKEQDAVGTTLGKCASLSYKLGNRFEAARYFSEAIPYLEASGTSSKEELSQIRDAIKSLEQKDLP